MTNDKRDWTRDDQTQQGEKPQQPQQQQGRHQSQAGSALQPDRQQGQQGRMEETSPQQAPWGEDSGQQAQQTHRNRTERLQSSQRSGMGDDEREFLPSGSVPRVPRQQQTQAGDTQSSRTWTQMSGGQQATQTSLEGGQWPKQAAEQETQKQSQQQAGQSGSTDDSEKK